MSDYWMGRDKKYPDEFTEEVVANGEETVSKVNALLSMYEADTGLSLIKVSSGWRPHSVNDTTSNSGSRSRHILALACDIADPTGKFPRWCARNQENLVVCGLYMEDWHWTPIWCHLQVIPPASGRRMYMPFDPVDVPPSIPLSEKA